MTKVCSVRAAMSVPRTLKSEIELAKDGEASQLQSFSGDEGSLSKDDGRV